MTQSAPTPFSRFSRIGIFKTASGSGSPGGKRRSEKSGAGGDGEDNWYIPYNGPYEAPRPAYVKRKERDSWGESLDGDDSDDEPHFRPDTPDDAERKGRPRASTTSVMSGEARRRQPPPTFVNISASGGVGESPSPRTSRDTAPPRRSSFANMFGFVSASPSGSRLKQTRPLTLAVRTPPGREPTARTSGGTEDEEYYNSYYSTLAHSPLRNQFDVHHSSEDLPSSHTLHDRPATASPSSHPYAVYPPKDDDQLYPNTAPLLSTNSNDSDPFRSVVMRPSQSTGPTAPSRTPNHSLKNSISSPDLRHSRRSPAHSQRKPLSLPKGRDRWLSPETWCDALFLPRPRFKVKEDGSINYGKRVVSPPASPVVTQFRQTDIMSRVVAHSRSMVDLQQRQDPGPSTFIPRDLPPARIGVPPRPKSFALDDLALPSPAPSLSRVLEEGQILAHQRKKWQMQATSSFQNSRTRSLSRARTKSQTKRDHSNKGPDGKLRHPHMDFLAARSFAGNQDPIPVLTSSPTESRYGTTTTTKSSSHAHSNSLSKTLSTSKTHSRGHSRNESWGKNAIKVATGAVLCNVCEPSPYEERAGFEHALHADETRVIRFDDPSTSAIDPALLARNTPSQASSSGDMRMGIALSTPPPFDDRESIHLPSHPYAQGGMYSYSSPPQADFAGPHPSSVEPTEPEGRPSDVSLRHRLPPRATPHPYALYADREQQRAPEVPDASRMWAQVGDGEQMREVRPEEIQYSPYMSGKSSPGRSAARQSGNIYDMVGIADALANAVRSRESRDSGFGGSDEHPYSSHVHRQPVEYDATRPAYRQRAEAEDVGVDVDVSGPSSKSVSPSPAQGQGTPSPPSRPSPFQKYSSEVSTPDTSSSQASPRPLGNVDDLDNFRDLFYRPTPNLSRKASTRSQLTTLARQLSLESRQLSQDSRHFEDSAGYSGNGNGDRDRPFSGGSGSGSRTGTGSGSERSSGTREREPIQFVFSDLPDESSGVRVLSQRGSILPFHPSITIPEDVEASSMIEKSPTEESEVPFRLGYVEHLATPPAVASTHRTSYTGQFVPGNRLSELDAEDATITRQHHHHHQHQNPHHHHQHHQQQQHHHHQHHPQDRSRSTSLQPPPSASDPSRTSYTTNSTYSRMSNLSDFPVPPADDGSGHGHLSMLNSELEGEGEGEGEGEEGGYFSPADRRLTFGDDTEIEELLDHLNRAR